MPRTTQHSWLLRFKRLGLRYDRTQRTLCPLLTLSCVLIDLRRLLHRADALGVHGRLWLNKEIKRRTDVVGVFMLVEAHDEWQVSDRRYLFGGSMAALTTTATGEEVVQPELITA